MRTLRGVLGWACFCALALGIQGASADSSPCSKLLEPARPKVYRVVEGPKPRDAVQLRADAYQWGVELLYVEGEPPLAPVQVDGIVLHSTFEETRYFRGTENPFLEFYDALKLIEDDKGFEAELIQSVAPEAMPRTQIVGKWKSLPDPRNPENFLRSLEQEMHQLFPRGFVLKPRSSFATDGKFPSERTPFVELWQRYRNGAARRIQQLQAQGVSSADIHLELRADPTYPGRILDALLTQPETIIIQERVQIATTSGEIAEEYRVHVYGGKVLVGATEHRWDDYSHIQEQRLRQAEEFVQNVVSRLPSPYNRLSYGVDVVFTTDGRLQIFETNAGWESQYSYADTDLWVANLVAEFYQGQATPFLVDFRQFEAEVGLEAKIIRLRELLRRPELIEAVEEGSSITEVLSRARSVLLAEYRSDPSPQKLKALKRAIREFHLEPYFTLEEWAELGFKPRS